MKQYFKPSDKLKPPVLKKHVIDTSADSVFINKETDSLIKTPPVIIAPPAVIINPPTNIKQRQHYGVEVSDSDYRFKIKP